MAESTYYGLGYTLGLTKTASPRLLDSALGDGYSPGWVGDAKNLDVSALVDRAQGQNPHPWRQAGLTAGGTLLGALAPIVSSARMGGNVPLGALLAATGLGAAMGGTGGYMLGR